MKNWKKYASLLLALVMCLGLAACGGDAPDKLKTIVIDDSIEYDYSVFSGTWLGKDNTVLVFREEDQENLDEAGVERRRRMHFTLSDANDEWIAAGLLQYSEKYDCVYAHNDYDSLAYKCQFDEDNTLTISSFGAFTKVSGDVPGELVGDNFDYTVFSGSWYLGGDIYASKCIEFDASGTIWSIYERDADGFFDGVNGGTLRVTGENRCEAVSNWYEDETFDCYLKDGMLYWGSEDGGYEVYY